MTTKEDNLKEALKKMDEALSDMKKNILDDEDYLEKEVKKISRKYEKQEESMDNGD